jgi:hypothetical protein
LATADEHVEVDALLVSREHGLVASCWLRGRPADDAEWDQVIEDQDRLSAVLEKQPRAARSRRTND